MYAVALDVAGKPCLVVGGGTIATEKVAGLRAAGAAVTVVTPQVSPHLKELSAAGEIVLARRPYCRADLDGVFLAIAATDQMAVNAQIAAEARAAGVLVNAVDDPPNCDFFAVAVVRRGEVQLAISTGGRSPAFARWLREYLDAWLPAELGELLAALAEVRQTLKTRGPLPAYESWRDAISDDVLTQLRQGKGSDVRERLFQSLRAAQERTVAGATGRVG